VKRMGRKDCVVAGMAPETLRSHIMCRVLHVSTCYRVTAITTTCTARRDSSDDRDWRRVSDRPGIFPNPGELEKIEEPDQSRRCIMIDNRTLW